MPSGKFRKAAPNLDGQGTTRGDMQCSYVSQTFGRCRYYGTIRTHRTDKEEAPGYCRVHYFDRSSAEAEQACEASQSWRRSVWDHNTGQLRYADEQSREA